MSKVKYLKVPVICEAKWIFGQNIGPYGATDIWAKCTAETRHPSGYCRNHRRFMEVLKTA